MQKNKTNLVPVPELKTFNLKNKLKWGFLDFGTGTEWIKAFTLVELIVVITILAILGTIAFISLQWYSKSSRDSVRISDVSNMKTSLELFHLNSGKYPLPDTPQEVTFSGNTLWYQWEFWIDVVSSLSRNISKIPTDPLTDKEYIFSVANNKNEYEILALLESDLVLNTINQTNAATITVTPRVDGTYNGVFIKTPTHIVPVPSIINSEVNWGNLILNANNIKSQVVSNWRNIPNHGNVNYSTGELSWLVLSVYTWSLDKNSNDNDKKEAMVIILEAYTGSELKNEIKYAHLLSKTWSEDLVWLFNTLILWDSTIATLPTPKSILNCWTTIPEFFYSTVDWNDTWLTCDHDIIVCNGTTWSWYIISACNVWSNIAWTTSSSYWGIFQWGNNADLRTENTDTNQISTITENSTFSNSFFIILQTNWTNDWVNDIDNLWWNTTNTNESRNWPCNEWYHVPTNVEWQNLVNLKWDTGDANLWTSMSNDLKIPFSGSRLWTNWTLDDTNIFGRYWSSTPRDTNNWYYLTFDSTNVGESYTVKTQWLAVRCFKN